MSSVSVSGHLLRRPGGAGRALMMPRVPLWLPALAVCLLASGQASAHHGISNFDLNAEIRISGVVTQLALINPHSWLYLDVTESDGRVTAWRCELRGASVLRRSGWTADMFPPGMAVTITGAPDRFAPATCYLGTAQFADGSSIDRYGQLSRPPATQAVVERPARRPDGHPNLDGDWAAEQRVLTDPRGMSGAFLPLSLAQQVEAGAVPQGMAAFPGTRGTPVSLADDPIGAYWNRPSAMPLTDAGRRAIEHFDGASADNPRLRCEPTNILFDWAFEADVNRIIQQDDRITLRYGSMGLERTVYLGLTGPPARVPPSRAGFSIGRWDGDVLVVETTGFEAGILSADGRVPHSDQLHVVERFSLDTERMALRRTYVAEDPLYFTGRYTGEDIVYPSDVPYQETPCDDRSFRTSSVIGDSGAGWTGWAPAGVAALLAGMLVLGWTVYRLRLRPADEHAASVRGSRPTRAAGRALFLFARRATGGRIRGRQHGWGGFRP